VGDVRVLKFQSTPLREGRRRAPAVMFYAYTSFNPRPCARGDMNCDIPLAAVDAFQSTPLREGRLFPCVDVVLRVVSIHAPARGATSAWSALDRLARFNPRPCARGDGHSIGFIIPSKLFQSTPLREGRRSPLCWYQKPSPFQSTPLREGRQRRPDRRPPTGVFQSTPLREGRRGTLDFLIGDFIVSIHAPARGATLCYTKQSQDGRFNPRPCARGDVDWAVPPPLPPFQSTPLREGRHHPGRGTPGNPWFQSTPLREGRRGGRFPVSRRRKFQSTPLREGRLDEAIHELIQVDTFQSTPLREGRPPSCSCPARPGACFNPRPCARGDEKSADAYGFGEVSIHAPARGATGSSFPGISRPMLRFNPRPCARGDWKHGH